MPNPNNDDLAKALERLSAGNADQGNAPPDEVSQAAPTPTASPGRKPAAGRPAGAPATPKPKPLAGRPVAPPPAGARPLQPPGSAAPPAPRPPGAASAAPPSAATRSASPSRPASPGPARPAAPTVPTPNVHDPQARAIDEDDRVIVPAPSADVFRPRGLAASTSRAPGRALALRRTLIPILLTAGVILVALGLLRLLWQTDNPLAGLPAWLVAVMFVFALVLWGLAAVNMLAVKHQLAGGPRQS